MHSFFGPLVVLRNTLACMHGGVQLFIDSLVVSRTYMITQNSSRRLPCHIGRHFRYKGGDHLTNTGQPMHRPRAAACPFCNHRCVFSTTHGDVLVAAFAFAFLRNTYTIGHECALLQFLSALREYEAMSGPGSGSGCDDDLNGLPGRCYQIPRYSAYVGVVAEHFTPGRLHEVNVSSRARSQATRVGVLY